MYTYITTTARKDGWGVGLYEFSTVSFGTMIRSAFWNHRRAGYGLFSGLHCQPLQWPKYDCLDCLGILCHFRWECTPFGVYGKKIPGVWVLLFLNTLTRSYLTSFLLDGSLPKSGETMSSCSRQHISGFVCLSRSSCLYFHGTSTRHTALVSIQTTSISFGTSGRLNQIWTLRTMRQAVP
jgi:hypothetical protein